MAIRLPDSPYESDSERPSLDLESHPALRSEKKSSRFTKCLESTFRNRRRLVIAGVLVVFVPVILLSLPRWGINPISQMNLPDERPADMSMCDYYTQKNHYSNSAWAQKALVKSIVDKAFVGTKNPEIVNGTIKEGPFNGILRPGEWLMSPVDLRKYFDGSLKTTNVDGIATNVNFFTGKTFTQYNAKFPQGNALFDHMKEGMYQYMASMLGCSIYGKTVDAYAGTRSMKEVHRFMDFKNPDWIYFIHQFQLGTRVAKFSGIDSGLFEAYLIEMFGPRLDKTTKKFIPCFENPALEGSILPPKFDGADIQAKLPEIFDRIVPNIPFKRDDKSNKAPHHFNDDIKRHMPHHHNIKRQDFNSAPPPLTTPVLAPMTSTASTPQSTSAESAAQPIPSSVLPVAIGAGVGAGVAVIVIGAAIAYIVIRKKKIAKRQSMQSIGVKPIEMQSTSRASSPVEQVDRSEAQNQNVVRKPGHKKNESVGGRSVRFSQHLAEDK